MNQFLITRNMDSTGICTLLLKFNPDKHPHVTSKAFNDFIEQFEFRYNAQCTELSRNVIENVILKWRALNNKHEPSEKDIETVRNKWVSKDKVRKLLVFFLSPRLQQDWKATEPNPELLTNAEWDYLLENEIIL